MDQHKNLTQQRPESVFLSLLPGFLLGKAEFQVIHDLSLHFSSSLPRIGFPPTLLSPTLWVNCLYVTVNHSRHLMFLWLCWNKNPFLIICLTCPHIWISASSSCHDFQGSEHMPKVRHLSWVWGRKPPVSLLWTTSSDPLFLAPWNSLETDKPHDPVN